MRSYKVISVALMLITSFGYGFGVGTYKWFPFHNIKNLQDAIENEIDKRKALTVDDLQLTFAANNSEYWKSASNKLNTINDPIILNNFMFEWVRSEDQNLGKTGAAKLVGNSVYYINQDDEYILSQLSLTKENMIDVEGIKAVFDFKDQTLVYVAYMKDNCATAKLVSLENNETLLQLECVPRQNANLSPFGGAVLILNESEFLLSTGTPTNEHTTDEISQTAQDDKSYWGKILKFTFDTETPEISIFSKGHRNSQDIAKVNGKIYAVEHGPRGGDEINEIIEGMNYGWPLQSFGSEYDVSIISKAYDSIDNHQLPLYTFMPSIGISSIDECPKNYASYYEPFNCLAVSSMRGGAIFFVVFDGAKVFFTERLDFGSRIRKFFVSDNKIVAVTDFEGVIVGQLDRIPILR
jgi:hypothetical protein